MIGRQNPSNEPGRRSLVTWRYVAIREKKKKGVVNTSITTTTVLTFDKSVMILSSDPLTNQTNSLEANGSSHVNKTLWLGCKQCSLHLKNKLRRHSRWPSGSEKWVATANSYVAFTHVRVPSLVLKKLAYKSFKFSSMIWIWLKASSAFLPSLFNPSTAKRDQDRISPYNINKISSRRE